MRATVGLGVDSKVKAACVRNTFVALECFQPANRSEDATESFVKKKALAFAATVTAAAAALSACEVTQINWNEHFYSVARLGCAPAPLTIGGTTLHNGQGDVGFTHVRVSKVYRADVNQDGVLDAVVLLVCNDNAGGNTTADEIQIFTRDDRPLQRLIEPDRYRTGNTFGSQFDPDSIRIVNGVLYTSAFGFGPGDAHCCPSHYDTYRWQWDGRGFVAQRIA
jgi:hypothetical protein